MNEANSRLKPSTAGIAYSVNAVCYLIVSIIVATIVEYAAIDKNSDGLKYLSYLGASFSIALGCFITMKFRGQKITELAPVKCHYKYYVIALLMIFGLLFSVSKINYVTLEVLKYIGYTPRAEDSYLPSLDGALIVPAILVVAVLPAVFEEFLFRGVILNNARAGLGDVSTILTVGFCFALFHGSAEQTVYQFICGCAFAFVAVRSGSILPGVLMHFINNALIIILFASGATGADGNLALSAGADIALSVFGGLCFAASIILLVLDKKPLAVGQKGAAKQFFIYASVGIAPLAVIWISSFFMV